jgi:two-component system, chemotaxis family, sensor kinase CheA
VSSDDEEFLEFLEIFQEESLERLLNVSRSLEAIVNGEPPEAHLDEVDRELHTIKGSARLLGFSKLGTLVHELEGLAGAYRARAELGIELLVEATDRLSALVEEAAASGNDLDDPELRARVAEALAGGATSGTSSKDKAPDPSLDDVLPGISFESTALAEPQPESPFDTALQSGSQGFTRELLAEPSSAEAAPLAGEPAAWDAPTAAIQTRGLPVPPPSAAPDLDTAPGMRAETGTGTTGVARPRGETKRTGVRAEDEVVRVRGSRLGELNDIVSDLTLAHQRLDTYEARIRTLLNAVEEGLADAGAVSLGLRRIARDIRTDVLGVRSATSGLQQLAVDVRLRPVSHLFDRVPREVRDLARQLGKRVRVRVRGEDTEMDRVILDALKSPLSHLLRNALDHGFETPEVRAVRGKEPEGLLELSAGQEGNRIAIRVKDDGSGVDAERIRQIAVQRGVIDPTQAAQLKDAEAIQLIFAPGFSTKEGVTQISGRGVGMDAVRRVVEDLKGDVQVVSELGEGSTITIRLPLTLLISRVMLTRSGGQRFALPTESIIESIRVPSKDINTFGDTLTLLWRGHALPLLHLSGFLGRPVLPDGEHLRVLVVHHGSERLALVVEEILEERSVVVKPIGWPLERLSWVSGAVQDPSGEIALQIHVPELFFSLRRAGPRAEGEPSQDRTILVVDDSIVSRQLVGRAVKALGFEPVVAVDGMDAWGLLERVRPLAILTDVEMPRLDGLGLARRVRAHEDLAGTPLVIVSNRGSSQDREAGLQAGADSYLTKSEFSEATLRKTLERLL